MKEPVFQIWNAGFFIVIRPKVQTWNQKNYKALLYLHIFALLLIPNTITA